MKVFQSKNDQIKLTDEYLIYDKEKTVYLGDLILVQINHDTGRAFLLMGQPHPRYWFTLIASHEDDLIKQLAQNKLVEIIEKRLLIRVDF